MMENNKIQVKGLNLFYGETHARIFIDMVMRSCSITGL